MENKPNNGKKKTVLNGKANISRKDEKVNTNGPVGRQDGYQGKNEAQQAINEAKQQAQHAAQNIQQGAEDAERGVLGSLLGSALGGQQQSGSQNQTSGFGSLFGDGDSGSQQSASPSGGLFGGGQSSGGQSSGGQTTRGGGLKKILLIGLIILGAILLISMCSKGGCSLLSCPDMSGLYDNQALGSTTGVDTYQSDMQLIDLQSPTNYTAASTSTENLVPVTTVSNAARAKYTNILGSGNDKVTIMVFMCGTDLESKYGMATNDLTEMLNAKGYLNDEKVNVIVETGGCKQWKNQVVSNSTNQRYRVTSKGLQRLEDNMGRKAMTDPNTLTDFIKYCAQNYPANRYMLIFWDHGGGAISGYGYDQYASGSMRLNQIDQALKAGGVKFDFIGFDACLMATLETATVCEKYADYLIASEETEPGCGWFYTNWLAKLSQNTSINTVELAKTIIDDFNEVCRKNNCGDTTTLSITDLAEFKGTVPEAFGAFATSITNMLGSSEYQTVAKARGSARQFGAEANIDHVDLIHFAALIANSNASGSAEAQALISALHGCIKYNRTSTAMKNSYGLSIYFPYKNYKTINSAIGVYNAIGMDTRYSTAVKNFASMAAGGQLSTGTAGNYSAQDSLFGSLSGGSSSSSDMLGSLLGSFLGGGGSDDSSVGSLLGGDYSSWFNGRMVIDNAEYFDLHELTNADMILDNGYLSLTDEKWALVNDVQINVFYDYGDCYIDLGMDRAFDPEGYPVVDYADNGVEISHPDGKLEICYDRTWMTINGEVVPYYYVGTVEDNGHEIITGRVPAMLKSAEIDNELVYIMVVSDDGGETFYIAGARYIYQENNKETDTMAKGLIELKKGDKLTFVCACYSYEGNYQATYEMFDMNYDPDNCIVGYMEIPDGKALVTYCLTDIYNNEFWAESVEF